MRETPSRSGKVSLPHLKQHVDQNDSNYFAVYLQVYLQVSPKAIPAVYRTKILVSICGPYAMQYVILGAPTR